MNERGNMYSSLQIDGVRAELKAFVTSHAQEIYTDAYE